LTGAAGAVAKVDTARRESEGEGRRGTQTGDNNEKTAATRDDMDGCSTASKRKRKASTLLIRTLCSTMRATFTVSKLHASTYKR
jgi:hypothetical protein